MKVKKSQQTTEPGYPTRRQFTEYRTLMGVAAIGIGTMLGGCRIQHTAPIIATGGIPPAPTDEPLRLGGDIAMEPISTATHSPMPYTIQEGDTLSGIAQKVLGKASRWQEIVRLNPGLKPEALRVGVEIRLPNRSASSRVEQPNNTTNAPVIKLGGKPAREPSR